MPIWNFVNALTESQKILPRRRRSRDSKVPAIDVEGAPACLVLIIKFFEEWITEVETLLGAVGDLEDLKTRKPSARARSSTLHVSWGMSLRTLNQSPSPSYAMRSSVGDFDSHADAKPGWYIVAVGSF